MFTEKKLIAMTFTLFLYLLAFLIVFFFTFLIAHSTTFAVDHPKSIGGAVEQAAPSLSPAKKSSR